MFGTDKKHNTEIVNAQQDIVNILEAMLQLLVVMKSKLDTIEESLYQNEDLRLAKTTVTKIH